MGDIYEAKRIYGNISTSVPAYSELSFPSGTAAFGRLCDLPVISVGSILWKRLVTEKRATAFISVIPFPFNSIPHDLFSWSDWKTVRLLVHNSRKIFDKLRKPITAIVPTTANDEVVFTEN